MRFSITALFVLSLSRTAASGVSRSRTPHLLSNKQ